MVSLILKGIGFEVDPEPCTKWIQIDGQWKEKELRFLDQAWRQIDSSWTDLFQK